MFADRSKSPRPAVITCLCCDLFPQIVSYPFASWIELQSARKPESGASSVEEGISERRFIGDDSARLRFVREARAAASVRHPNVASVFHLGESGSNFFTRGNSLTAKHLKNSSSVPAGWRQR
jgi:hypothetical protein